MKSLNHHVYITPSIFPPLQSPSPHKKAALSGLLSHNSVHIFNCFILGKACLR